MADAVNEPLVADIELRRNTSEHVLTCCCEQRNQHLGAPILVVVNGKWLGAASCDDPDHLGRVITDALDQARVALAAPAAASTGTGDER